MKNEFYLIDKTWLNNQLQSYEDSGRKANPLYNALLLARRVCKTITMEVGKNSFTDSPDITKSPKWKADAKLLSIAIRFCIHRRSQVDTKISEMSKKSLESRHFYWSRLNRLKYERNKYTMIKEILESHSGYSLAQKDLHEWMCRDHNYIPHGKYCASAKALNSLKLYMSFFENVIDLIEVYHQ